MDNLYFSHNFFQLPSAKRLQWWHKNRYSQFKWSMERIKEASELFKITYLLTRGMST